MKKIISFVLVILFVVTLVACNDVDTNKDVDTSDALGTTELSITGKVDAEPYNGIFKTGYSRVVITPTVPITNYDGTAFDRVADDIYATCVAINDGENTAMLVSVDIGSMNVGICDNIKKSINQTTKIPVENIVVSATHSHSMIVFEVNDKWALESYKKIGNAAMEAVEDLADSSIFVGTGKTTGMAFVRRYINSDGTMSSVNPSSKSIKCVSEADDIVQVIRFERDDRKDIVMANWQCHFADAIVKMSSSISADITHYLRLGVESADDDALLVYFAGAGGNVNLNPPNRSFRKYKNYVEVAEALSKIVVDTANIANMTKLEAGKINTTYEKFYAPTKQDDPAVVAAAKQRVDAGTGSKEDTCIVERNKSETCEMYLSAITFGDFAFVGAPYEMFDNNGLQLKEGSPYNMTFILTNAGGALAYMPSYEAWTEYGGYETEATYFGVGTAELLVDEYIRILKTHKTNQ